MQYVILLSLLIMMCVQRGSPFETVRLEAISSSELSVILDSTDMCDIDAYERLEQNAPVLELVKDASEDSNYLDTLIYKTFEGYSTTTLAVEGKETLIGIVIDSVSSMRPRDTNGDISLHDRIDTMLINTPAIDSTISPEAKFNILASIEDGGETGLSIRICHYDPDFECYGITTAQLNVKIVNGYVTSAAIKYKCE